MLNIKLHTGIFDEKIVATVETMEGARSFLDDFAAKCRVPGEVISFDEDPDYPGCADAAIFTGGQIKLFNIEVA